MPLRLPAPPVPPTPGPAAGAGPVVLFLPAHDEEATVAAVVGRVPELVHGRRVECLVVDDGSSDRTAELAARAGAVVLGSGAGANRGLGAAVRAGLAAAVRRGAAAVAFCDADGEYDPRELDRLVAPILEGRADYVVGSRFAGDIQRMLPHRRVGNRLLTRLLGWVARARISDGQSGYRALSWAAAADAEVVHDYNYAQVLTVPLPSVALQQPTGGRERFSATWTRARSRLPRPVLRPWRDRRGAARVGRVLRPPGIVVGLAGSSPRHLSAGGWGAHLAAAGPDAQASVVRSPPPPHDARSR